MNPRIRKEGMPCRTIGQLRAVLADCGKPKWDLTGSSADPALGKRPYCELEPNGWDYRCTLCGKKADAQHLDSDGHRKKVRRELFHVDAEHVTAPVDPGSRAALLGECIAWGVQHETTHKGTLETQEYFCTLHNKTAR